MSIPILMYHEVGSVETLTERYTVPTHRFREQLQYLRDHDYQTVSLGQLWQSATWARGDKKVIITFDDNNLCHHSISTPILVEFKFQATFFVVSSFIDTQKDMLSTAQLVQMKRAGMSIESHSHTHRFLSDLAPADLRGELEASRRMLEDRLQGEVRFVSCPGGRYHRNVLNMALEAGYWGVCTSAPGLNGFVRGQPPQTLDRFLVSATTPLETFAKIVSGDGAFVRSQVRRHRAKALVKGLLGNTTYDRLWRRFRRDM
jgi:peptidoglycan/xylan/chitin deacetylase (PgdA/CDA1 family)